MAPLPKVTGLSPKEGPPGTRIVIRGEHLGKNQHDVIGLTICGLDCLTYVEWQSTSKIIARIGAAPKAVKGNIIVTTRTGGVGTCTVQFRCYIEPIGPLKETAVWVDETHMVAIGGRNRPTSPSQLHPEDPLGISDESVLKRFPEEELHDLFPEGSGNILSDNFIPVWYLLENHQQTKFEDLKAGLVSLQRKVSQHKQGPLSFLKSNISSIVECLEVLGTLQQALHDDAKYIGTGLTEKLEVLVQKTRSEAESIFQSVLERKEKAEMTRNALSVLQRYRFLFNLPANIEKNIQKGDYDIVINDYARAKSLFHDSEVPIFKKLYQEVEMAIQMFQMRLNDQLKDLPTQVEEQKRIIRYLTNLETPGDPGWDCIVNMKQWLQELLYKCRDKHQVKASDETQNEMPEVVAFVEDLLQVFEENFPGFWKLGQSYISGNLYMKEISGNKQEAADKLATKSKHFQDMVRETVTILCNLIRASLISHTLPKLSMQELQSLGTWPKTSNEAWLPHILRVLRTCYGNLLKLDLSEEVNHDIQELLLDLRIHTLISLIVQSTNKVRVIYEKETWNIEKDDYTGGITQLPNMFEKVVIEVLQLIHETVIVAGPKETDIFSRINVLANIKQHSQNLILAFVQALKVMPSLPVTSKSSTESLDPGSQYSENERILIVLSNTAYCSSVILPRILESYTHHGFPDMSSVIKVCQNKFTELGQNLFETYIENKSGPVVGAIETSMYFGEFNWKNCPQPEGIGGCVKDVVMNMVKVHAGVFGISPPYLPQVMKKLSEAICEELARLYACVGGFKGHALIQLALDISALHHMLSDYITSSDKIKKFFEEWQDKVDEANKLDKATVASLLEKFKSHMKLEIACFKAS